MFAKSTRFKQVCQLLLSLIVGVMELRLSYKKGVKGTVLTLISMHETIKKILQTPDLLKCLAG